MSESEWLRITEAVKALDNLEGIPMHLADAKAVADVRDYLANVLLSRHVVERYPKVSS